MFSADQIKQRIKFYKREVIRGHPYTIRVPFPSRPTASLELIREANKLTSSFGLRCVVTYAIAKPNERSAYRNSAFSQTTLRGIESKTHCVFKIKTFKILIL